MDDGGLCSRRTAVVPARSARGEEWGRTIFNYVIVVIVPACSPRVICADEQDYFVILLFIIVQRYRNDERRNTGRVTLVNLVGFGGQDELCYLLETNLN